MSAEETLAVRTFMEAACESKVQGGAPMSMADVFSKAMLEAGSKLAQEA